MSLDAAFPESPSPQGRAQWVTERIFEWAGYGGTHLRVAAFFMENLLALYGRQIRELGQIRNSFGDFEASWIASSDVGAMGAALLADPELVTDRTTVVGAAERASHVAIAEIISKTTGRPVRYQHLTPEEWRNELIANTASAGQPNPTAAAHLSAQSVALRRHSTQLVTNDVQRLTGRPAATLKDFVERNRQTFMPNPDVADSRSLCAACHWPGQMPIALWQTQQGYAGSRLAPGPSPPRQPERRQMTPIPTPGRLSLDPRVSRTLRGA